MEGEAPKAELQFKSILQNLNESGVSFENIPKPEEENVVKKDETKRTVVYETDPLRLSTRQKQIDYGYNTRGYQNYLLKFPE